MSGTLEGLTSEAAGLFLGVGCLLLFLFISISWEMDTMAMRMMATMVRHPTQPCRAAGGVRRFCMDFAIALCCCS